MEHLAQEHIPAPQPSHWSPLSRILLAQVLQWSSFPAIPHLLVFALIFVSCLTLITNCNKILISSSSSPLDEGWRKARNLGNAVLAVSLKSTTLTMQETLRNYCLVSLTKIVPIPWLLTIQKKRKSDGRMSPRLFLPWLQTWIVFPGSGFESV